MDRNRDNCGNCYWGENAGAGEVECHGSTPTLNLESNNLDGHWPKVAKTEWCRLHSRAPVGPISG